MASRHLGGWYCQLTLTARGTTGILTAATQTFALISVAVGLTIWTDGDRLWCTHGGQRRIWPAVTP
jgi:hypothetical protein